MPVDQMACPECGTMNAMVVVINDTRQYNCSRCGTVYYTPNSCVTNEEKRDK